MKFFRGVHRDIRRPTIGLYRVGRSLRMLPFALMLIPDAQAASPKTYTYQEMGIFFSYPDDWRADRTQGPRNYDDSPAILLDRMDDPKANGGIIDATIFIFTEKRDNRSLAQRAAKDVPAADPKPNADVQFRATSKPRTVAGLPALEQRVDARVAQSEWKAAMRQVYIPRGGLLYIVSGMNQSLEPADFERVFDTVLQTLTFSGAFTETPKPRPPTLNSLPHLSGVDRAIVDKLSFYTDSASHIFAAPSLTSTMNDQEFFWGDGKTFRQFKATGSAYQGMAWTSIMFGEASNAGTMKREATSVVLQCPGQAKQLQLVTDRAEEARLRTAAYYGLAVGRVPTYLARLSESDLYIFVDKSRNPGRKNDERLFIGKATRLQPQPIRSSKYFRDGGSRVYEIKNATVDLPVKGGDRITYSDGRTLKLEPVKLDGSVDLSPILGPELAAANKPISDFSICRDEK